MSADRSDAREARPARGLRWFFTNPDTGEVVVAQMPNAPLLIWLVAAAVRLFVRDGAAGTAVMVVSTLALGWWSVDEILRGSSPFRRVLGAGVLAGLVVGIIRRVVG